MANKKIPLFKYLFLTLFFSFTTLYIASLNGYYEYTNQNKVALTVEKIKEFEQDIKDGKKIDLENYVEIDKNNKKRIGLKISQIIEKCTKNSIEKTFKLLSKMIEN